MSKEEGKRNNKGTTSERLVSQHWGESVYYKGETRIVHEAKSRHVLPIGSRRPDGELSHLLALSEIFDFGVNEIPQSLEIKAALCARPHEQVPPDTRGGDRVVDAELHGTVEPDHLLHEMVWAGVYGVRPGDANGKPPTQRLKEGET